MRSREHHFSTILSTDDTFSIRVTGNGQAADLRDHAEAPLHPGEANLGLVCEGGGQRGIFTAGVLDSFMKENFFPFHTMIGVSAGAQNLSAYACGEPGYARHAIMRYTTQKAFFDPVRFARGGHLIDLDWYFDTLQNEAPLDLHRAHQKLEGRALFMCASRCDTLTAEYLPFHIDRLPLSIKASSAIPLFYRGGVALNGVDYWDGGVADALPVQAAHRAGSDCIVLIRTVPRASGEWPADDSNDSVLKLRRKIRHEKLQHTAAMVETHLASYRNARAFIERPPRDVTVIELAPKRPLKSRLLGSAIEALRHDYRLGQKCGRSFMEHYARRQHGNPVTWRKSDAQAS